MVLTITSSYSHGHVDWSGGDHLECFSRVDIYSRAVKGRHLEQGWLAFDHILEKSAIHRIAMSTFLGRYLGHALHPHISYCSFFLYSFIKYLITIHYVPGIVMQS